MARLEQERAAQVERPLTKEERMERKKMREITARYDAMQLDENGDFVYVGNDDEDDFAVCNSNVDHVNEMQAKQRAAEKKKHAEKIQRDKADLERDRQRKDKTKKATQKREKRRM